MSCPLILLLIQLRPTKLNKVAYISTATYLYTHWVPRMADFVPLNKDYHPRWGHIKPVVRAIEVSHAACKDEFRRNPRSHSWRLFFYFYDTSTERGRQLLFGGLFSVPVMTCRFCQDAHPPLFLSSRVDLDSVELAYNRHACVRVVCGCGSVWPIKACTPTNNLTFIGSCYCCTVPGTWCYCCCCAVRVCCAPMG